MTARISARLAFVARLLASRKRLQRRIFDLEQDNQRLAARLLQYRKLAVRIGEDKDFVPAVSDKLTTGPRPSKVTIAARAR